MLEIKDNSFSGGLCPSFFFNFVGMNLRRSVVFAIIWQCFRFLDPFEGVFEGVVIFRDVSDVSWHERCGATRNVGC